MRRIVFAKSDLAAEPEILLVRIAAIEFDQHAEPTGIEVADAEHRAERVHRPVAHQRSLVCIPRPTDAIAADDGNQAPMKCGTAARPTVPRRCVRPRIQAVDVGLDRAGVRTGDDLDECVPSGNVRRRTAWRSGFVHDPT